MKLHECDKILLLWIKIFSIQSSLLFDDFSGFWFFYVGFMLVTLSNFAPEHSDVPIPTGGKYLKAQNPAMQIIFKDQFYSSNGLALIFNSFSF